MGGCVGFLVVYCDLYVCIDEFVVRVYELLGDCVVYVGLWDVVYKLDRYIYMVYCSPLFVTPSSYIRCVVVEVRDDGEMRGGGVV